MLVIGSLRDTIEVLGLTKTRNEYGESVETYTVKHTLRAGIKNMAGVKNIQNFEKFTSKTLIVTTHYRDVAETDRIRYNGDEYKINNIVEIGFKEGLQIFCDKINE